MSELCLHPSPAAVMNRCHHVLATHGIRTEERDLAWACVMMQGIALAMCGYRLVDNYVRDEALENHDERPYRVRQPWRDANEETGPWMHLVTAACEHNLDELGTETFYPLHEKIPHILTLTGSGDHKTRRTPQDEQLATRIGQWNFAPITTSAAYVVFAETCRSAHLNRSFTPKSSVDLTLDEYIETLEQKTHVGIELYEKATRRYLKDSIANAEFEQVALTTKLSCQRHIANARAHQPSICGTTSAALEAACIVADELVACEKQQKALARRTLDLAKRLVNKDTERMRDAVTTRKERP